MLTVCTMMPMRSVPHRVVCLLGLDDGVFPRAVREDGDDLRNREPACGERDPRSEDRQLMLDAIVAATEKLVVIYSGADERTGAERPPAVPLGELLDALDDLAGAAAGGSIRDAVLIRHPLQPFDSRTVTAGALGRRGPFSFDPVALAGARSAGRPRRPATVLVPDPLPMSHRDPDVELAALVDVLTHPAKGFLRRRLDVAVPFEQDDPPDNLPVHLDALEVWGVGERILRDRLAGVPEEECRQAEWRRGVLPPAALGGRTLTECCTTCGRWWTERRRCGRRRAARSRCPRPCPAAAGCAERSAACMPRCWSRCPTAGCRRRLGCSPGWRSWR